MVDTIAARLASEPKLEGSLYRLVAFCERERTYDDIAVEVASHAEMREQPGLSPGTGKGDAAD